jgi:zinc D-Ala-D-Ala carboxypeptidase
MTPISDNFTLEELTASEAAARNGWPNTPGPTELVNLGRLARLLEQVRATVGKPIIINSAYRCKRVNDAVGSKDSSQHLKGCAADIRVPGMTPDEVVRAIISAKLPFDQVIKEFDRWTHISVPSTALDKSRAQALIIDRKGTRIFA